MVIFEMVIARINTEFITMSTTGNSTDFGILLLPQVGRQVVIVLLVNILQVQNPASNIIEFITTATLGNAIDFGDMTVAREI